MHDSKLIQIIGSKFLRLLARSDKGDWATIYYFVDALDSANPRYLSGTYLLACLPHKSKGMPDPTDDNFSIQFTSGKNLNGPLNFFVLTSFLKFGRHRFNSQKPILIFPEATAAVKVKIKPILYGYDRTTYATAPSLRLPLFC